MHFCRIRWTRAHIEKLLFFFISFFKKKTDLYPVHLGVISPPPSCVPVQMTCCYCNRCEPEIKCEVEEFDFQRKDGRFLSRRTTFTSVLISLSWLSVPQLFRVRMSLDMYDARLCRRALIRSEAHVHAGEGGASPLANFPLLLLNVFFFPF